MLRELLKIAWSEIFGCKGTFLFPFFQIKCLLENSLNKKTAESAVFYLLIIVGMQLLYIDCVLHFDSFQLGRFVELLTAAKLLDNARLVKFAFEFLNGFLNVLAFTNRNYDHCIHLLSLVPRAGVEPARIAPLVFETSASTDSAIWAFQQKSVQKYNKIINCANISAKKSIFLHFCTNNLPNTGQKMRFIQFRHFVKTAYPYSIPMVSL